MRPRFTPLFAALLALAGGFACSVTFSDTVRYRCTADKDCAGDDFVCAAGACCKPSGEEVCDGVDNDCDGRVDNRNRNEECNGEDDDCNGRVDDGFDLRTNANHCGRCNNACTQSQYCAGGQCINRVEGLCFDGFDNDNNGKTDCDDPSCDGRSCGMQCVCRDLRKAEARCDDSIDNEMDSKTDCLDDDCVGKACRAGCQCRPDGGQLEQDCTDGVDNDLDSAADCLDDDCVGQFCTPPEIYFQCTASQQCKCNGGVQIAEVGSIRCADNVDNDCNGKKDCQEDSCVAQSCAPDGGMACVCDMGRKKEGACANGLDDDLDLAIDCADTMDCAMGTACTTDAGTAGTCSGSGVCN